MIKPGFITRAAADELNAALNSVKKMNQFSLQTGSLSTLDLNGRPTTIDTKPFKWLGRITSVNSDGSYNAYEISFNGRNVERVDGGFEWNPTAAVLISYNEFVLTTGDLVEIQHVGFTANDTGLYIATLVGVEPSGSGQGAGGGAGETYTGIVGLCVEYTDIDLSAIGGSGGPPSGAAGGDLEGTYPVPTLKPGVAVQDGDTIDGGSG